MDVAPPTACTVGSLHFDDVAVAPGCEYAAVVFRAHAFDLTAQLPGFLLQFEDARDARKIDALILAEFLRLNQTVDVAQAFENGADYIVVGRPIRDAADPRAAALAMQGTIAGIFGED